MERNAIAMRIKHLTVEQRYKIQALLEAQHNQKTIAECLGVHKATICRELKRNRSQSGAYDAKKAHKQALSRRNSREHYKLKGPLKTHVESKLRLQWSPEQISHTLPEQLGKVSHEAIYLFVHKDTKLGGELHNNLRWGRKKRRKRLATNDKRGRIKNATSIEQRGDVVALKSRIGDWEADLMELGCRSGYVLTLVERRTKYLLTALLPNKRAETVTAAIIDRFRRTSLSVHTITYDNGKEFSRHEKVNKNIGCQSYFCHPYSSWERGLNENTNGLIRQYIPKGQSINETSWQDLRTATNRLNNRPRKSLNWLTPNEFFRKFNYLPKVAFQC